MTELKTLEALAAECERLRDLCTGGIMIHPSQVLEAIKPFIAARPEPTEMERALRARAEQGSPGVLHSTDREMLIQAADAIAAEREKLAATTAVASCPCGDQGRPGHPLDWCGQPKQLSPAGADSQVLEAIKPFIAARPEPTESRAEQYGTPINQYDRPEPTEMERALGVVGAYAVKLRALLSPAVVDSEELTPWQQEQCLREMKRTVGSAKVEQCLRVALGLEVPEAYS